MLFLWFMLLELWEIILIIYSTNVHSPFNQVGNFLVSSNILSLTLSSVASCLATIRGKIRDYKYQSHK